MNRSILNILNKTRKISAITSYDYTMASLCDQAGIDIILVGDSAGVVMLGYNNTIPVTMNDMCLFTRAVSKATKNAIVVSDMPFGTYNNTDQAIRNSRKLIRSGANAVKLEGGSGITSIIKSMTKKNIQVVGHLGLQPQTMINKKNKIKGRTKNEAINLIEDAKLLEESGAICIILEMVNHEVTRIITKMLNIPTIGIGSGIHCDGQILVIHDMLGLYDKPKFKFVKKYLTLSSEIIKAIKMYKNEVENCKFPTSDNWFSMKQSEYEKLQKWHKHKF
ncbi:MAG: 3-methyl-2-oxobutanoate hydroxymethyltransferase [Thaumarchaeota archaeon]|nr:3-methyl-2-oxobutanoate hydroxymethyltransferase [Nitrososphaerota archaeon]MCY3975951.1 3-methyl-2-oxobutanoate hydroxymethyltransferase [Nitrososphaerota archaeon]